MGFAVGFLFVGCWVVLDGFCVVGSEFCFGLWALCVHLVFGGCFVCLF